MYLGIGLAGRDHTSHCCNHFIMPSITSQHIANIVGVFSVEGADMQI